MNNGYDLLKDINEFDVATHLRQNLTIEVINPKSGHVIPPPLYISQNEENPEHSNELHVIIQNSGDTPIVLKKYDPSIQQDFLFEQVENMNLSGIDASNIVSMVKEHENANKDKPVKTDMGITWSFALDFTDFVEEHRIASLEFKVDKIQAGNLMESNKVIERLDNLNADKKDSLFKAVHVSKLQPYHGTLWAIQYIDEDKDLEILPGELLKIQVHNLVVSQRPSIRYLDVHWRDSENMHKAKGFFQKSVLLKRPSNFVRGPFPLISYWLDDHNLIYISREKEESKTDEKQPALEIDNELKFGISNIGLEPLSHDCRKDAREGPYFELVMLGGSDNYPGFLTERSRLKDIELEIDEDEYGNKWTHHKLIQGPVVTWRIEPKMFVRGERNKTIMGVEEKGTITFKLSRIKTFADQEGMSMIYLKYYNIPDHDDNQLVLFVQKKWAEGSIPSAGLRGKFRDFDGSDIKEAVTAPLKWHIASTGASQTETIVELGDKVGINTENPESALHVEGDIKINGDIDLFKESDDKFNLNNWKKIKTDTLNNQNSIITNTDEIKKRAVLGTYSHFSSVQIGDVKISSIRVELKKGNQRIARIRVATAPGYIFSANIDFQMISDYGFYKAGRWHLYADRNISTLTLTKLAHYPSNIEIGNSGPSFTGNGKGYIDISIDHHHGERQIWATLKVETYAGRHGAHPRMEGG